MDHVRIDLAVEADVARILEISNWAAARTSANFARTPETMDEWRGLWQTTSRLHPWLVARAETGEIVGFAKSGRHRKREAYDWCAEVSVYLDPGWHGRGLGTALYQILLPLLRRQGYCTVLAGITAGHEASERLHAKMGFVRCATFHRIGWKQDRWQDVGYWELHLQPPEHVPTPVQPVADVLGPAGASD